MRFRPGQHLRRQTDIRAVREQGRRVDGRAFTVWWRPRPIAGDRPAVAPVTPAGHPAPEEPAAVRACVIASTAAVGCAVRRNRAKRRLRELFRQHQGLLPAQCDLLLIARAPVLTWETGPLEKSFSDACGRISRDFPAHA